ncbi:hypothetical protein HN681_04275 [archaeon]|jgi:hypothetical protein|nr:hypothetical protein [archaeon]MBT3730933.1 hypothetical protein [archaeon]MBT4669828.1 hypothetical protein [archaeon]MBT5288081.1 hypothetical protein [archaeon]MBT7053356.1 hypothetical protein [archaeon]
MEIRTLEEKLPEFARGLIESNYHLSEEERQRFLSNPDAIEEHNPSWHQWGIQTHSIKTREAYDTELRDYLTQWSIIEKVDKYLGDQIDGISKEKLLRLSLPIHDLGKFLKKGKTNFDKHEEESGRIILNNITYFLREEGLTDHQIHYVAFCAANHFAFGYLRRELKIFEEGYNLETVRSQITKASIERKARTFKNFSYELGILYLVDSLAKTDIKIEAETDDEIDEQTEWAKEQIQIKNLNPRLIKAIRQRPVNIELTKQFFNI